MTRKELYNIIFENFVQAKRELIREGYQKSKLESVDFNEVFNKTKHKMLEEKVSSLKRENEMLKRKLSQRKDLDEATGFMSSFGGPTGGGAGSKTFGKMMTKAASPFSKTAKADIITDRMIEKGLLSDSDDISKFTIKVKGFLDSGMKPSVAAKKAMDELKSQSTLGESRRRRY